MHQKNSSSVRLHFTSTHGHGSWLRYFAAALCLGVAQGQEQVLLDYWWVYNDTPSSSADAVQILRVTGEKGEKYEEVLQPSDYKLMADSARSLIGRSMRGEVVALASQYISEGMSSPAAYEKAWTTVYRRRVLSGEGKAERAKLEALVDRMASAENLDAFMPGELLVAMHVLVADEKRQKTEEGRQLLEKIANRLRAMGYDKASHGAGSNDELMALFMDALQHGMNSFAAFRDALFKENRDKIMRHSLFGYRAPWGAGMGGRVGYSQASRKVTTTVGSGTQPPVSSGIAGVNTGKTEEPTPAEGTGNTPQKKPGLVDTQTPDSENPFLATAPDESGVESDGEDQPEEKKKYQSEETSAYAATDAGAELSAGSSRAMTFAMPRSVMMSAAAGDAVTDSSSSATVGSTLYWNSASGVWDMEQPATWVDAQGTPLPYTAGSQVEFGDRAGVNKTVQIADGGVVAGAVTITGAGYQFSGGDMEVTNRLSTTADAGLASTLVIGSSTTPLYIDVADFSTFAVANLSTNSTQTNGYTVFESGSLTKTGNGTLLITNSVQGSIADVKVQGGVFQLGSGVTLDVGANRITGGTLENVELQLTGDIWRPVSQNTVTVHNLITAFDANHAAVLTDVQLHAGTATEYATLYNVVFAGTSTLTGYITNEKTQAQREIGVAAGGVLTINQATFDLRGMASGSKVLIVNGALDDTVVKFKLPDNMSGLTGTLEGWNTVNFVYSGIEVNEQALDTSVAGVVSIKKDHSGKLYWNGAADDKWNPGSSNWSSKADLSGQEAFTALSNVYFVAKNTKSRAITVTQDMVVMNLDVTDGGYSFSGARVAVLGDAKLTPADGTVTFHDQLVVQGMLTSSGSGCVELKGGAIVGDSATLANHATSIEGDMTVGGTLTVTSGSLTISGNVSAAQMSITVNGDKSTISGNLTSTGLMRSDGTVDYSTALITIGGTAAQHYTGVVKTHDLTVKAGQNDVYFSHLHVECLTVGENTHVHVLTASDSVAVSSSEFHDIYLSGTLSLDSYGTTYNHGYRVNVQHDDATLIFDTGCAIEGLELISEEKEKGTPLYKNVGIDVRSGSASVTAMQDLGTLTVKTGALTISDAGGAIHGDLVLDKAKLKLGEGAGNIMAAESGIIQLMNGARLDIGTTTQTLYANNELTLSGTSTITGAVDGGGLLLGGDSLSVKYESTGNSIDAKLTVEEGKTLILESVEKGSSLEIGGHISGSGAINLSEAGMVVLPGANSGFTGLVTVGANSNLALHNTNALSKAGVALETDGTLTLDASGAVNLKSLTLQNNSSLVISSIVGTDDASVNDVVLNIAKQGPLTSSGSGNVVLNLIFSQELETMTTYNIMTGVTSIGNISFNVMHNDVAPLHSSQYQISIDSQTGVLYMLTMMGNVWDGGSGSGTGYWSKTNTDNNWTTGNGNEYGNYNEDGEYKAAIFGDLNAGTSNVCLSGDVKPGDIYFTAESTAYTLSDEAGGSLAAGTHIHKLDAADVTLALGNNATLGNVDIQEGSLILSKALAVAGTVTVDADAMLEVKSVDDLSLKMGPNDDDSFNYTVSSIGTGASATLSGVTMDAAGIRGAYVEEFNAENLLVQGTAHLSDLNLNNFTAKDDVTLSNVTLSSSGLLKSVTIGQGVTVLESSSYTLSGDIVFEDTLINQGTVTLEGITSFEIGKITPTAGAAAGEYTYRLIAYDKEDVNSITNVELGENPAFTKDSVYINGVSLGDVLQDTDFKYAGNGSFTLSIGNKLTDEDGNTIPDGAVGIPQWDERWGKTEKAPAFSRIYAETIKPSDSETDKGYAHFEMAAGKGDEKNYYHYESIVEWKTASKVNYGNAIVVTLSSDAKGDLAVGGRVMKDYVTGAVNWDGAWAHNVEVWVDDHSKIRSIVGGLDNGMYNNVWGLDTSAYQSAATHVLVDADYDKKSSPDVGDWRTWDKTYIIAGSRWCNQYAESFVTVKSGEIYNVFGASCGGHYSGACYEYEDPNNDMCLIMPDYLEKAWYNWLAGGTQTGTSHVFIDGGRIGEIFAAGNFCALNVGKGNRAVEMVITGGTIGGHHLRVFGGGNRGEITGDIYVRMEGNAKIESRLVGGSNVGTVNGNIVLDLISGEAFRVDAAGLGWEYENGAIESTTMNGEVLVNLYRAFVLGIGEDLDLKSGIYGGKETTNYVNLDGKAQCTSTLHFAESGKYELGYQDADGWATTESHYVTGFDVFSLEDKAHAVLALEYFDINMQPEDPDDKRNPDTLIIQGKGVVEVIGRGANFERDIELRTANPDETDASLQKGATLWISTCDIGTVGNGDVRTITATDGTTVDFTGFSITGLDPATPGKAGLDFNVKICGNGVDGKGALYMGESTQTSEDTNSEVNAIFLPRVELTDSASVKVVAQEALYMDSIKLAGHTFTKLGAGDFITRTLEGETEADVPSGTILVQQGSFGFALENNAAKPDVVLADGAKLKLNATGLNTPPDLTLRSLSGAGTVNLNGSTLTLQTESGSLYHEDFMADEAASYDQFTVSTGYGYAVFSGLINDGKGAGSLVKDGSGVQYISGSSSSYTGGTLLKAGRLYLLGTSEQSTNSDGTVAVASGVVGTGKIKWDGAGTELYLGHGTHIYNDGTASGQGAVMTIGVEGALKGTLKDFVGVHSRPASETSDIKYVTMGGADYVEIDTHNLKSIAVDAMYADGSAYEKGTDIDRNKMLLVAKDVWDAKLDSAVTWLSDAGYNEAVYSGVLKDGKSGDEALKSSLHKVGDGTLVLDQVNTYSGGTEVVDGTLRLRGWGTMGSGDVEVVDGASLMLAYTRGYGDETTELDNNITLSGSGDTQWLSDEVTDDGPHALTDGKSAALISAVGLATTVVLNGDITDAEGEAAGGVLHSGDGTLVLRGNSSYTGGTLITRGVVEVQSASGLGSTKEGLSEVVLEKNAELRVTVMPGYDDTAKPDNADNRLVTTLASVDDDIQGKVYVEGTELTERVLHIEGNGYMASSTTLKDNGTFLLSGLPVGDDDEAGIKSQSGVLSGSGAVVVSDAAASGAKASFDFIEDYTGDFRVEGDHASIQVKTGTFTGGSIEVEGRQASVQIGSNVSIEAGEVLHLRSTGTVPAQSGGHDVAASYGTGAALISGGSVSVAAGALLSVSKGETSYDYDIKKLATEVTLTPENAILAGAAKVGVYHAVGSVPVAYQGQFNPAVAINQQAAGAVNTAGGLTLTGGSTYEADSAHISLMGGSLTLDTMENNLITLRVTLDNQQNALSSGEQLVLFSGVSSMTFGYDNDTEFTAQKGTGVHYTRADRYFTGSDYVNSETVLVYDSEAGVVYLESTPILVPEPTTATLSLLALTALLARRRRR